MICSGNRSYRSYRSCRSYRSSVQGVNYCKHTRQMSKHVLSVGYQLLQLSKPGQVMSTTAPTGWGQAMRHFLVFLSLPHLEYLSPWHSESRLLPRLQNFRENSGTPGGTIHLFIRAIAAVGQGAKTWSINRNGTRLEQKEGKKNERNDVKNPTISVDRSRRWRHGTKSRTVTYVPKDDSAETNKNGC